MRIAAGCMMFLMLAANAASASEAFVTQVAHDVAAAKATAASYPNAASASALAAPAIRTAMAIESAAGHGRKMRKLCMDSRCVMFEAMGPYKRLNL